MPLGHLSSATRYTLQRNNASITKISLNFFVQNKHINFLDHQILPQNLKNVTRFGIIPPRAQRRFDLDLGVQREFF